MYSNSQLTSFDNEKLDQLLQFLLVDSDNLNDKNKTYKFPNIAAEILGTNNDKIISFFLQKTETGDFLKLDLLLDFFMQFRQGDSSSELNFTRAGYVCKVLNSLILEKSGVFLTYLLIQKQCCISSILNCCHSKSVSGFCLNLITLVPTTQQLPVAMAGIMGAADVKNDAGANGISEIKKETFEKRLEIFDRTLEFCLDSEGDCQLGDLHANLANIIMIVINKDFPEQMSFIKVVLERIPQILRQFCDSFHFFSNNKLGNVYLVLLEVLLKDSTQKLTLDHLNNSSLEEYTARFFELLCEYFGEVEGTSNSMKLTPSFSWEISRLNPKVYKVMEAIIVTLKWQSENDNFESAKLLSNDFEKHVFMFFETYPFNNILHNQLKKFLFIIVEKGNQDLLDKYFCNNNEFYAFLSRLEQNKCIESTSNKKVKKGYTGHVVTLITLLKDKSMDTLDKLCQSKLNRPDLGKFRDQLLRFRIRIGNTYFGRH